MDESSFIPSLRRFVRFLSNEQLSMLNHWIYKTKYDALRAHVQYVGEGDNAVAYTLRAFDEYRCIFVHIPRTAGISVAMALFNHLAGGHVDARYYRRIFGSDFWKYFKFTFVRNPYARLVSAYEFLKRGGHPASPNDQRFRDEILCEYTDFSEFVLRWLEPNRRWLRPHFRPQHEFVRLGRRLVMDFVGHVECLQDDFCTVCKQLGIKATLEHLNDTGPRRTSLEEYYASDAVIQRVREVYAMDFEMLGYSQQPPV